MREMKKKKVLTISAKTLQEYDSLFNETSDRLGEYEIKDIDDLTTRFYYTETKNVAEDLEDEFSMHHIYCTCADCPFLQIGEDRRRKWFPCDFATYGESKIDSPACEIFYKEAVRRMRGK